MEADLTALALAFPSLRCAPGIAPWNPTALDNWACGPVPGSGAFRAAQFVLALWNCQAEWRCGRFDLMHAMGCWDACHRAAFLAWARDPWWP